MHRSPGAVPGAEIQTPYGAVLAFATRTRADWRKRRPQGSPLFEEFYRAHVMAKVDEMAMNNPAIRTDNLHIESVGAALQAVVTWVKAAYRYADRAYGIFEVHRHHVVRARAP